MAFLYFQSNSSSLLSSILKEPLQLFFLVFACHILSFFLPFLMSVPLHFMQLSCRHNVLEFYFIQPDHLYPLIGMFRSFILIITANRLGCNLSFAVLFSICPIFSLFLFSFFHSSVQTKQTLKLFFFYLGFWLFSSCFSLCFVLLLMLQNSSFPVEFSVKMEFYILIVQDGDHQPHMTIPDLKYSQCD